MIQLRTPRGSRRKKVHAKMKRTREERSWADWLMPQRRSRAGRRKGQRKRVGTRRMEGMESQPGWGFGIRVVVAGEVAEIEGGGDCVGVDAQEQCDGGACGGDEEDDGDSGGGVALGGGGVCEGGAWWRYCNALGGRIWR